MNKVIETMGTITLVNQKGKTRTFQACKFELPTMQHGNKKIVNTSKYNVLLFSTVSQSLADMLAANGYTDAYIQSIGNTFCHNCDKCKGICYNKKAYRYNTVIQSRLNNFYHSLDNNFVTDMIKIIDKENTKSKKVNKKLMIRIHVDGEMYATVYTKKWFDICNHFINDSNVKFYTYTKSYEIMENLENQIPSNLNVNLSLMDGMTKDVESYVLESKNNVFYASDTKESIPTDTHRVVKCKGFDCANCSLCATKTAKKMIITTPIH